SALDFDEITVDEILIPRVNVIGVEINSSIEDIKKIFLTEMYSRMPVYEKSMDNIVGIITQKDFFKFMLDEKNNIRDIMQDAFYISGLKFISQALRDMQRLKIHMAIVMDQHGGTQGIITMEDIIEELVGEIYDENDEISTSITQIDENEYEVSGEYSLNNMLEELDLPDDSIESSANSVGGWIMEILGHIPEENETIEYGFFKITVLSVNEQSIEKIKLQISVEKDRE
ncbi:MAG: CBS domain-containing protein, partial [Clostridiales bacterium]|nr:CBS domain-containing protein [Clostridiales bacterium]